RTDLAREIALRGGLRLVGHAPIRPPGGAGPRRMGLSDTIAALRPWRLVMSSEALRDQCLASAASELHGRGLQVRTLDDFYERHFAKVPLSELSEGWLLANVAQIR